ncbi:MAG TPA: hypothetical protein PLE99_04275 [Candidatus Thiothrix moscowensis]|uniref:hypothetical protein n=1 Tax=unclassified Thiothrix TaxID=2636184 RepID=UPI0025CC5948|nr:MULTISPECIES: hypothetical protein [unclassified Thiothrix]HRJ51963.1 hypothetical protein [Candidatus Thiothrix moscowensis]HRJ92278.1 hypothetical protein [Candidatus Thiothrix moscowensis]
MQKKQQPLSLKTISFIILSSFATGAYAAPPADLALTFPVAPTSTITSSNTHYEARITNIATNSTSASTTATFTLPTNVTQVQAPGCNVNGNSLSCAIPALASNASRVLPIDIMTPATATTLQISGSVAPVRRENNTANNSATVTTTVSAPAIPPELVMDFPIAPVTARATTTTRYEARVRNTVQNSVAASTTATITLPANVTLVQAPNCTANGNVLNCAIPSLPNYGYKVLPFDVITPATDSSIQFSAAVVPVSGEANPNNNSKTVTTVVSAPIPVGPDIVVTPPATLNFTNCWYNMNISQCPPELQDPATLTLNPNNSIDTGGSATTGIWSQPDPQHLTMEYFDQNGARLSSFTGASNLYEPNCFEGTFEFYQAVHSSTWRGCIVP